MKLSKIVIATIILLHHYQNFSRDSSWLTSGPISGAPKKLVQSVSSYPAMGITESTTGFTAQQYIQDRTTKATVPTHVGPILQQGNFSVLRAKGTEYHNYPTGKTLFPKYPTIATKFDTLINTLIQEKKFVAFFRKVHLNVLNELYKYLMNIYTNFNLQHVGIKDVKDAQGRSALEINIPLFLQNEKEYEANKKTLIINHFINIIESQLNGAIRSVMPKIPHLFSTYTGKTLIQNDYSIDLTHFILKQIEPAMIKHKQAYLEGLSTYLAFFQEYTSFLAQPHPTKGKSYTAFVDIAETINDFLYGSMQVSEQTTAQDRMQQTLAKMDPPMFTFNYDDMRALKLIPHLAKSLPPNTKSIDWPAHIVQAANEIIMVDGHPMAYFKDAAGNIVKEAQATELFIIMQSGKNLFEEQLLAQPDWLNSWEGVMKILQGCFGNFAALLGMGILDPCTEALIQNTVDVMAGKDVNEHNSFAHICQNLLHSYKEQKIKRIPTAKAKGLQALSSLLPSAKTTASQTIPLSGAKPNIISLSPSSGDISNMSPSTNNISGLSPSMGDISPVLTQ